MNILKKNNKAFYILLITLISGIFGSIYNLKLEESYFIRYKINVSPDAYLYADIIDKNIGELNLNFFNHTSVINFAKNKVKNANIIKDKRIEKYEIGADIITFKINNNLDDFDNELEKIIFELNQFMKNEINILLNTYLESASSILYKKIKQEIRIYENNIEILKLKKKKMLVV